jgi:CMP-N-acetylneuraminic acid synthetase
MHAMEFMEQATGRPYDSLVLLQPTCPIRDPRHIDQAVTMLWGSDLDTAASVKGPFKKRDPILKAIRGGVLEDYHPLTPGIPVEPFYLYNASIYAMKRTWFVRERRHVSPRQLPIPMDDFHSTDIDTLAPTSSRPKPT